MWGFYKMDIDYLGIILSSVASLMIGILVSRYFSQRRSLFYTAKRRKILDPVDGKFPQGIQIKFDGKEVDGLCEWTVGVWNGGNVAISRADFLQDRAIVLKFENETVLKAGEPAMSRGILNSKFEQISDSEVVVDTEFMDRNDWCIATIYTQIGKSESKKLSDELKISCDILNLPDGIKRIRAPFYSNSKELVFFSIATFLYGAFAYFLFKKAIVGINYFYDESFFKFLLPVIGADASEIFTYGLAILLIVFSMVLAICCILLFSVLIWSTFSRPPKLIRDIMFDDIGSPFPLHLFRKAS